MVPNRLDCGNVSRLMSKRHATVGSFAIQSGRGYEIGPDCMVEGDVIVAILGRASPCALRPKMDGYTSTGPIYVMDGTVVKSLIHSGAQE